MKSRWIGLVFVIIFSVFFVFRQYKPDTWLIGWDSLHPEFNYQLAFSRVFSGAWRESQGLGAVAVHSHMSELPRIVTLWAIDRFVPTSAVRWIYILLMLVLGVVGSYVLLVHILSRMRGKMGMGWVTLVAIVGSLAYLFNLSTLHHFLVPFEMFIVLFGLLPWTIWSASRYLEVSTKGRLLVVMLIQLFLSSSAFAATLWVVYFGFFLIATWFLAKQKRAWLVLQIVTLMTNLYWLLPSVYGVLASGRSVAEAKINLMFSPEAWLNNVAYGTWQQITRMESFILQWMNYNWESESFELVASQWMSSNDTARGVVLLNVAAGMVGVGLLVWIARSWKDRYARAWSGMTIAGVALFVMMLTSVGPIGQLIEWMRDNVPLLGELLRTPFTKISIPLQLTYSLLIAVGLMWVIERVRWGIVRILILLGVGIAIVFPFGSWVIKGNMLGEVVATSLPGEYLTMFEKLKEMGVGRMVAMPTPNLFAWEYRDWGNGEGYEGANFTQFGIPQPLLIRDFDRWSPYNERFYNEFSNSLYQCQSDAVSQCQEQVASVLEKYDVKYVLLDESVIAPGQGKEILRIEETNKLAEELKWEKKFQEGFLTVWEVPQSHSDTVTQYVSAPGSYTWMEADTSKVREDVGYGEVGHYVTAVTQPHGDTVSWGIYPFAGLMREEAKNVKWGEEGVAISTSVSSDTVTRELVVPGWEVGEIVRVDFTEDDIAIPAYTVNGQSGPVFLGEEKPVDGKSYFFAKVSEGDEWREYRSEQKFEIRNEKLEIEVRGEPFVYDFAKQGQGSIGNCDVLKRGKAEKSVPSDTVTRYVVDERGAVCDYVVMEAPFTRVPYLLRLRGENVEGRSIKFFLWNTGSKRNDIEYLLGKGKFDQTFALLPWDWDGYYTLNIETRSFGQRAENRMDPVVGMYVPLEKIARARIVAKCTPMYTNDQCTSIKLKNNLEVTYVKKTGTWLYGLGLNGQGLVRLSQGYDEGWVAFVVPQSHSDKVTQLQHVKVDGWANGWIVGECTPISKCGPMATNGEQWEQEAKIVIIYYWPQLLQYLGFVMLGVTIALVSIKIRNHEPRRSW